MIEYNGMKTVGVTDYTKKTTPTHFKWKKVYKINTHKM